MGASQKLVRGTPADPHVIAKAAFSRPAAIPSVRETLEEALRG
jgi:hypothetical protein